MRILAIRGRNLASLAGDFEVDFQAGPLADAGVFAISGPTGAGKSTLLDALCLALFHNTPRLLHAVEREVTVPDAADQALSPQDPRNLLRRGCGEGFAEVDFIGVEGVAMRARWEVQRARRKADGRLQNPRVSLVRLDTDAVIAAQLRETREAIERAIGLSFDQFRRAVLLAQNDFATLLKAKQDERADLLEALTSTEVFSRVSMLAHQRRVEEDKALEELRRELDVLPLLDDGERAALEARIAEATTALGEANRRHAAVTGELAWHEQGLDLQTRLQDARAAHSALQADLDARAEEHRLLLRWQALAPLREPARRRRQLQDELDRVAGDLARQQAQLPGLARMRAGHEAAHLLAVKHRDAASESRRRAQPAIAEARRVDEAIRFHRQVLAELERRTGAERAASGRLEAEASALERDRARQEDIRRQWQQWRDAEPRLAVADGDWADLGRELDALVRALDERARIEAEVPARQAALAQARAAHATAGEALAEATAIAADCRSRHEAAREALAGIDPAALDTERRDLTNQRRALDQAGATVESWVQCRTRQAAAGDRLQGLIDEEKRLGAAHKAAVATLGQAEAEQEAATSALERTQLAGNALTQRLREALVAGEPCLVCGATEHPGGHDDAGIRALLATLQTTADAAGLAEREARQAAANVAARVEAIGEQLSQARLAVAEASAETGAVHERLASQLQALQLDVAPGADSRAALPTLRAALAQADVTLRERERALDARDGAYREAQSQLVSAGNALAAAGTAMEARRSALEAEQRRLEPLRQQLEELQSRSRLLDQSADTALTGLQARCGAALQRDAVPALLARWREGDGIHRAAVATTMPLAQLQTALRANAAQHERLREHLASLAAEHSRSAAVLADAKTRRAQVLAAEDVEAHAAGLEQAEAGAREACERHAIALEHSRESERRLQATIAATQAQQDERATRLAELQADIERALHSITDAPAPAELDTALAAIPVDLGDRIGHLQQQHLELERLKAVAGECADQLGAWQARKGSARPHREVALDLQHARHQVDSAHQQLATEKARRDEDDRRRAQAAGHREQIAARAGEARRWQVLAGLIGSADGRKFRTHAQQFTLEVLLEYANQHLERLAPRYRLQRGNEPLSLLVVDRGFGEEVRSVHSLSGGESFLVSLALALGLASLSSERVQVESLFIDEGFGSLDADTLNIAMEALDRLQSEGRRVGVISHVHDMAERIGTQVRVRPTAPGRSVVEVS